MTLDHLIKTLQEIQAQGHGQLPIYITDNHNGLSEEISNASLAEYRDDLADGELFGQFEEGENYIEISFG